MQAFLKSSEGCFQLKPRTTTIGRHRGADIILQSAGVADHHAALEFSTSDNSFILQDFNSLHGTFVNGCQVQNAAVKVSPGDILRFGAGGASFQLVVDEVAQMSYPPVKRLTAWTGQLQVVAEPKPSTPAPPPHPPSLQWHRPPGSPGRWAAGAAGHVPHPPPQKRPLSAWARSMATTVSPDAFSRSSTVRTVSTSASGDGMGDAGRAPSLGTQDVDLLPREKGENLLQLEKEICHLSGMETVSKQKDTVIRDLQDEIAAMAKTLAQVAARNEVELTQKLLTFDRELGAKMEEIRALREQVSSLQKGSSQIFCHSLYERDLEIGRLRKEGEKVKRDHALAAGLVASLRREIVGKEQKMQQLKQEVEKVKKESREKDNQLAIVSAKCSRIKEETKQEHGEREVLASRKRIRELERDLEGLRREVQKYHDEQERSQDQLVQKAKAEEELQEACARQALQLQEMGRRERLLRADVGQAREQLESFKSQVLRACSPEAVGAAGTTVTEQQVIEKVRQISEKSQQSHEREKCLQEELGFQLSKEKELSESVEVFKKSLQELQVCLRSSCSSNSLRQELGRLEAVCHDPPILAIRAAVVEMARVPLSWLEGAEQLLASAGMDLQVSSKGLVAALGRLVAESQEAAWRNRMLQAQLERDRESQAALLQEHVKELEAKHQQELQIKIQQVISEKDKERKEILASAVAQEKDKCKQSVEEEQKKIQDLETHLRSLTEVNERRAKEQEVSECKLKEALHNLEEAVTREMMLQQQVLMQEEQLKTVQKKNELQRQKLQEETEEYKEQSKQHALTIVALEERLLEAKQQQKILEEEKAALVEKMEGSGGDARMSVSGASLEVSPVTASHCCLRKFQEELAAAQRVLLSKEAIIAVLTKELGETRARMSDMRGELSEELIVELEQNLSRLKQQERELNLLREKLSQMSSLVEKKDRVLEAAAEELRQAQAHCQALEKASREMMKDTSPKKDAPGMPVPAGEASERISPQVPALDLANLSAKCWGLRHEETIRHQKEGLAELRERVKVLEKRQSSAVTKKGLEPLVVLMKDLPEEMAQKTGFEKETASVLTTERGASKVSGQVPNEAIDGAVSSEMEDVTYLGEKMYLDVIGALGSLMKVKELSGMQPLKHLPLEQREKAELRRRKDLELLYDKIRNLKSRLERKEEVVKDYGTSVEQLRCQEEMAKLEEEAYRQAEEKALLKEAVERTQLQLSQKKRLLRTAKQHKPGAKKPFCSEKLKTKKHTAEALKTGST